MSVASHHKSSAMQILVHSITLPVDSRGSSLPFIYKVSRANSIFEQFQRSLSPSALLKIIIAPTCLKGFKRLFLSLFSRAPYTTKNNQKVTPSYGIPMDMCKPILGDPGADIGGGGGGVKVYKRAGKNGAKKSKEHSLLFFAPISSARLDFSSPPLSAPGSPRMVQI